MHKPKFVLIRNVESDLQVLGNLFVFKGTNILFSCKTLEPAWKDNKPGESCAPKGEYKIVFEKSPRFNRDLWELKGVPNRGEIKIHVANYYHQLEGCIAVGSKHIFINSDTELDVSNSRNTLDLLHKTMGDIKETTILIC